MEKFGNGGSLILIASMSGTITNRVRLQPQDYCGVFFLVPSNFENSFSCFGLCCTREVYSRLGLVWTTSGGAIFIDPWGEVTLGMGLDVF